MTAEYHLQQAWYEERHCYQLMEWGVNHPDPYEQVLYIQASARAAEKAAYHYEQAEKGKRIG